MPDKKPMRMEQLDLKLVLAFTNAYQRLYEKNKISEDEFDKVLALLDTYQNYTIEEFEKKLKGIFKQNL
ncbi:MAG: hypothetical protein ACLFPF_08100 [Halanaerobiales bacterium]